MDSQPLVEGQDPTTTTTDKKDQPLEPSLFVQHLATYPAVAALAGLVASFPVAKVFVSNAIPLAMAMRERSKPVSEPIATRAKPALRQIDSFGDNVLTRVDRRFPVLQTAQPSQVRDMAFAPVHAVNRTLANSRQVASRTIASGVVAPSKRVTQAARRRYARVYDTQGRALVRSRFDPVVQPVNDRFEGVIVDYLPGQEPFPQSADLSNEFSRSWRLARTAARRAVPLFSREAAAAAAVPRAARTRTSAIYAEKLAKHSHSASSPSAVATCLAMAGTAREVARAGRRRIVLVTQTAPENAAAADEAGQQDEEHFETFTEGISDGFYEEPEEPLSSEVLVVDEIDPAVDEYEEQSWEDSSTPDDARTTGAGKAEEAPLSSYARARILREQQAAEAQQASELHADSTLRTRDFETQARAAASESRRNASLAARRHKLDAEHLGA